jgi:hypothetical protein
MMDEFMVLLLDAIQGARDHAEEYEREARALKTEKPEIAALCARYARAYRRLEECNVELLGRYTER